MVQASKIRKGSVILFEGRLCTVLSAHHHTPGNLRAMMQAKLRDLKDGTQFEHRFRSTEEVEVAFLEKHEMEYLYEDGGRYHLMNCESYEQTDISHELFEDAAHYLLPNTKVVMTFFEGNPVGVELPQSVELKIVEAEPAVKKQTASSSYKKAIVETGFAVMVPPFVERGETVRINTETGEYQERVTK